VFAMFRAQADRRQIPKLLIDKGDEFLKRLLIPIAPFSQKAGNRLSIWVEFLQFASPILFVFGSPRPAEDFAAPTLQAGLRISAQNQQK
jgi:hypothetical protein